jgi:hypothetical protein
MATYRYEVIPEIALQFYKENGMEVRFDPSQLNGVLTIEAPDEETAQWIRETFTDIRMWRESKDTFGFHTDDGLANELIASTILSEKAQEELEDVRPEVRLAIEALIAEGLIVEKDGKYSSTERGEGFLEKFNDEDLKWG